MSTADILAVTGAVQSLAWAAVALVFGLRVIPQLRVAAPPKQDGAPKQEPAAERAAAVESIAAARGKL